MTGNVLVVDDNDSVREMVSDVLTQKGYNVALAKNGKEGLDYALQHPELGVILSDGEMPVLSGFGFLETYRNQRPDSPTQLVMMGGGWTPGLTQRAKAVASAILEKPFRIEALENFVGAAYRRFEDKTSGTG